MKKIIITLFVLTFSLSSFSQESSRASSSGSRYLEQFNVVGVGKTRIAYEFASINNTTSSSSIFGGTTSKSEFKLTGHSFALESGFQFVNLAIGFGRTTGSFESGGIDFDAEAMAVIISLRKRLGDFYYNLNYFLDSGQSELDVPGQRVVAAVEPHFALTLGYAIGETWGLVYKRTQGYESTLLFTDGSGIESEVESDIGDMDEFKFFKEFSLGTHALLGLSYAVIFDSDDENTTELSIYTAIRFSQIDLVYNYTKEEDTNTDSFGIKIDNRSHIVSLRYTF